MNDTIDIIFTVGTEDELLANRIRQLISSVSKAEKQNCNALTIILADDELLKGLKRDYLSIDEVTDVLAFDVSDSNESIEGDIYISMDRVRAQAIEHRDEDEVFKLIVHGFLHLCGYDHDDDVSLERMVILGEKYIQLYKSET